MPVPKIVQKAYWALAALGGLWAVMLGCAMNPWVQRHLIYAHELHHGHFLNVTNAEEYGFARGQVTPFFLPTPDGESLFCWHVLPMDVYFENEVELASAARPGVASSEEFTAGLSAKLLRKDPDSQLVVNFHGNAGPLVLGHRPSIYRSMAGIPHTHTLVCDYRGFGISTLNTAPHMPTEPGLITDGISIASFALTALQHPASRTVLLGQSLGTAVTAATALYFADPASPLLPSGIAKPAAPPKNPGNFAGIVLAAAFTDFPELLKGYRIKGIIPVLSPIQAYPKIANFLSSKILDRWPTLERLEALVSRTAQTGTPLHVQILHARNDQEIPVEQAEKVYEPLEELMMGEDGVTRLEERLNVHGVEKVQRGAHVYRRVETKDRERSVEVEVMRYGGHSEGVGWGQVSLAVRRAFQKKVFRPGLDVE